MKLVVTLAIAYVLLGAAGLLLAIPPDASLVFPAAGLALACALQFGRRALVSVWLGAAILKVGHAWFGGALTDATVFLAVAIASGAALQAWAGHWLINRWQDSAWRTLGCEQDAFRFLLLGGVLAGMLSPTIGVASLYAVGSITFARAPFTWWNWYVSDTLGILVFAPLTLCWLNRQDSLWQERLRRTVFPMLVTLSLAVLASYGVARWETQIQERQLRTDGEAIAKGIADRLITHREVLASVRHFVEATPDFSFHQFEQFTHATLEDNLDIFALSFNDLVANGQRFEYEQRISGLSPLGPFQITERDSEGRLVRAAVRPEYVTVRYIVPLANNQPAVGYDIYSEPIRRAAIERARVTRAMAVTAPILLVQEQQQRVGLLELLPVEAPSSAGASDPRRLIGFAVAVVKADEMIDIATRGRAPAGLSFHLTDHEAHQSQGLLYRSDSQVAGPSSVPSTAVDWRTRLRMGDRDWVLSVTATDSYRQRGRPGLAWAVGVAELLFATLLQVLMLGMTGRTAIIKRQNIELLQTQGALRTLSTAIEQSPVSVVITDPNAAIEYVNPQFTRVTGFTAREALGKNPKILNSGLTPPATFRAMWRQLAEGRLWSGELINRRKNGETYWEEAHISPVRDVSGQTMHYVAVKLDISERKRAEQEEKSRNRVLELLAKGAPLSEILVAIVRSVEESHPRMLCSILLLDSDGKHLHTAAAPSLPDFFKAGIDGLAIGLGVGSCGTAAVTGERVIVVDIQTHPYWANFRELAARASLGSSWSEPIRSASGRILGTFAIYHHEPREPAEAESRLIEQSANLAAIAIDRSSALEALRISEEQYRLLAEHATDVIWTMDLEGRFTYISPSIEKLRGYTVAEALQQSLEEAFTPESRDRVITEIARAQEMLQAGLRFPDHRSEFEQPRKDGSTVWVEITITGIYNALGEFVGMLGVSRDTTERKQIQDRIAHMAHHDTLTNLPNRALFSDRISQALVLAQRNQTQAAVMFIDLDKFKPINDVYGHAIGDQLLVEAAARLRACVRASDTVSRIGGDEFVVLLTAISCSNDALLVGEAIRLALKQPFDLAGYRLSIGSSIGVALAPDHGVDPTELCKHADIAMYYAKKSGRDNVKLFQPGMSSAEV